MMCGVSCMLSHNNLHRGLKILVAAMGVTFFSVLFMRDAPIIFGILHLLGSCVVLYALLKKLIDKIPVLWGIVVCIVLFFVTYNVDKGYLLFEPFALTLPDRLYESGYFMIFGFRYPFAAYSDYFPLLPWMFAFFAGVFLGRYMASREISESMYKSRIPFLSMLGTNAFFVYLIHQPLIFGVYYLISLIGGI